MCKAPAGCEIDQPTRDALGRFFEQSAAYLVNQEKVQLPENSAEDEIAGRWRTLEETVAAIRAGDADCALGLLHDAGLQAYMKRDRRLS